MNLHDRMNQFRLASRSLYNTYFYTQNKKSALEAEERFSDVLESLFQNMVSLPTGLKIIPYYEEQPEILATYPDETNRIYIAVVEVKMGSWKEYKILGTDKKPKIQFEYYFDWDDIGIKDNQYVRGKIISFPSNEVFVGKMVLLDANDVLFIKA